MQDVKRMQSMKAVVLTGPGGLDKLEVQDLPRPVPERGQVLVRLHASALNRRDFWITKGLYPDIKLPCILGSDGAGVVESAGKGVDGSIIGKEVVIYPVYDWGEDPVIQGENFRILGMPDNGTFSEYICVPVENIFAKPPHLNMQQTAAISLAGLTAWRSLVTKALLKSGEIVLITGIGGGVASLAFIWARALGAGVIVTSSSDQKLARAKDAGAMDGFNYTLPDWQQSLQEKYGGVDVVLDGNCGAQFNPCFKSLNPAGRYIIFGFTQGAPAQGFDPSRLFFKQLRIEGTTMSTPGEFEAMLHFITEHRLEPVIDKTFSLLEAGEAVKYIETGEQMGKVTLDHLNLIHD